MTNREIDSIPEDDALDSLLISRPMEEEYAWEDEALEQYLRENLEMNATYYPTGELIWALDNSANLNYGVIPANKYRLSWVFEIYCVYPEYNFF